MTYGFKKEEITFEIVGHIGKAGKREVNLVSWCGKPAKIDIREWDEFHEVPKRGITMTDEEARELYETLKARYEA